MNFGFSIFALFSSHWSLFVLFVPAVGMEWLLDDLRNLTQRSFFLLGGNERETRHSKNMGLRKNVDRCQNDYAYIKVNREYCIVKIKVVQSSMDKKAPLDPSCLTDSCVLGFIVLNVLCIWFVWGPILQILSRENYSVSVMNGLKMHWSSICSKSYMHVLAS